MTIPMDKVLHLAATWVLCQTLLLAGVPKTLAGPLALLPGTVREIVQHQGKEGWRDEAANALGMSFAIRLPLPQFHKSHH